MKFKKIFILGVVLILSKESYAACFSKNDTTSSCRYKEGDTWCRDHKKGMPYAYNCIPFFSENKSEATINNITKTKKYIDNKNGTITDTKTSLMWMKCSLGQSWKNNSCLKKPRQYYWSEIFSVAKKINIDGFSGYSNWRIPTPKELFSLVQCNKRASGFLKYCLTQNNLIDKVFFPNTPNTIYWTSIPDSDGIYAKTVSFHNGLIDSDPMRYDFPVRLVRSQKDKILKGTKKETKYLTNE